MSDNRTSEKIDSQKALRLFVNEFVAHLESETALAAFLKAQLHIETLLLMLLDNALLIPDRLPLDRMSFSSKVHLCVALGLVHAEVEPALTKLARIRNGFAHTLWPEFGDEQECDFLNVVRQSAQLRSHMKRRDLIWQGYRGAIWAIWIYLFEQLCRASQGRKVLADFWSRTVDASELPPLTQYYPMRPLSPEEAGESLDPTEFPDEKESPADSAT